MHVIFHLARNYALALVTISRMHLFEESATTRRSGTSKGGKSVEYHVEDFVFKHHKYLYLG